MKYCCLNPKCRPPRGKFIFEGEPKCPKCGVSINDPYIGKNVIIKLASIHFHLPSPVSGMGMMKRACDGKSTLPSKEGQNEFSTGNPYFVNCELCKKNKIFLEKKQGFPEFVPDERTENYAQQLEKQRKGGK